MDPDTNLNDQLQLASRLIWQIENDKPVAQEDVLRLAELVVALDEWIKGGGFKPELWR